MIEYFFPDEYLESAYVISYEKLYQQGYRGIIYDIDNTLVEHGAPSDRRSIELMERLKRIGFQIVLLSNNKKARVSMFNEGAKVAYISRAAKPVKKNYKKAMELMNTTTENTIFIGDQLFTDVLGAKRTGIRAFLVRPIHPKEEIQIVWKRKLEAVVLARYLKAGGSCKSEL